MRFGRRDGNHKAIVAVLRGVGATVFDAGDVGGGFPDLVVGYKRRTYLLECKVARGKLKPTQVAFYRIWKGGPCIVVRTPADALRAIGLEEAASKLEARLPAPAGAPRGA